MVTRTHTLLSLHCGEHSLLWTQCVLVLFRIFQTLLRPTNKINVKRKERREWRETYINLQVSFNEAAAIRWSLHALLLYFFLYKLCLALSELFDMELCFTPHRPAILRQLYIWEKRKGISTENEKLRPWWYISSSRMQHTLVQSGCAHQSVFSKKMSRFVQV